MTIHADEPSAPGDGASANDLTSRAARRSAEMGGTLRPRRLPTPSSSGWAPPARATAPQAPQIARVAESEPAPAPVDAPPARAVPIVTTSAASAASPEQQRYYLCCEVPSGDFVEVIVAVTDGARRRYFTTSDGARLTEVDEDYFVHRSLGDARSLLELDAREMAELESELGFVRTVRGRDPLAEVEVEVEVAVVAEPADDTAMDASVRAPIVDSAPVEVEVETETGADTVAAAPFVAPTPPADIATVAPELQAELQGEPAPAVGATPRAAQASAPESSWVPELEPEFEFEFESTLVPDSVTDPAPAAAPPPQPEDPAELQSTPVNEEASPLAPEPAAMPDSGPEAPVEPEPLLASLLPVAPLDDEFDEVDEVDALEASVPFEPEPLVAEPALEWPFDTEPAPAEPEPQPQATVPAVGWPDEPVLQWAAEPDRAPAAPPAAAAVTPWWLAPAPADAAPLTDSAADERPASTDPTERTNVNEENDRMVTGTNAFEQPGGGASVTPIWAVAPQPDADAVVAAAAQVSLAKGIAFVAHRGMSDKVGAAYIDHPGRVAERFDPIAEPVATAAAWLHDVLEHTDVTAQELLEAGVLPEVVDVVVLLSRTPDVPEAEYYGRIRRHAIARSVKIADVDDNSAAWRVRKLDFETQQRLAEKYRHAREMLGA